jgi:predicted nucleic acid-binding protein
MEIKPVIVDTSSYSAFKRGEPDAVEIVRHIPGIIINPVVVGELLSGFALGSKEEKNKKELELFLNSDRVKFVTIDRNTSEHYTKIYKELRSKGKPIPTNDLWIAATAMQYGGAVFTYDSHFEQISNLKVISKFEDLKS